MDLDLIADASGKSRFGFDAGMFDEAGFEFAFYNRVGFRHRFVYITADYAAVNQHVLRAMGMDQGSTGRESFIDGAQCGQLAPGYGKRCGVEILNRIPFAPVWGDCFAAICAFTFGVSEDWLVGEAGDQAIAILARNILGSKHRLDTGISGSVGMQIAEAKIRTIIWATDDAQGEGARGDFIRAVDFRAFNFAPAVQADQALTHGSARCGAYGLFGLRVHVENRIDNLAVSGAAAEHAAERIHYIGFGGRIVFLEERRSRDQHAGRTRAALCSSVTKKCLLQAVK